MLDTPSTSPPQGPSSSPPGTTPEPGRLLLWLSQRLATAPLHVDARLTLTADAVVPLIADWCVIDVLAGPDEPRQTVIRHADLSLAGVVSDLRQRHSPNPFASFGVAEVLWDACDRLISPIDDAVLAACAVDPQQARILAELELNSCLMVPLLANGRPIGVMTWAMNRQGRLLEEGDRVLAREAAAEVAAAVADAIRHEAKLFAMEADERETDRLRHLQTAAAALGAATSADAVCGIAHGALVGSLQAQTCLLANTDAHLRPIAWRGWPDAEVSAMEGLWRDQATPFGDGLAAVEAIVIEDGRQLRAAYPAAAGLFDRQHTEALVVVPLQTPHGGYGVMAIGFAAPRRFSVADRQFVESLAGHCAGTLERITLLADRERLLRERDILMTTLSHDLKNPITVIGMHTHMMRQGDEAARQRATAIQQASDRMLRLVENLHDLTDFLAGHGLGHVELQTICPKALTEAAMLEVAHLLGARRLTIQPQLTTGLAPIRCDVNRLQRAVVNILAHGLRRSPSGGTIWIDLQRTADGVLTLDVADEGAAIGPDDDDAVFDAYCHTAKGGSYTVGLGMVVARHIAEAHGGQLTLIPSLGCLVRLTLP